MEQTLTLNSVSVAVKFGSLSVCTAPLLGDAIFISHTISTGSLAFFFFGLSVAPVEAFERHTVVSLCGLSEECFDQCQLNSDALHDPHCTAEYSKMWPCIYISVHADFK